MLKIIRMWIAKRRDARAIRQYFDGATWAQEQLYEQYKAGATLEEAGTRIAYDSFYKSLEYRNGVSDAIRTCTLFKSAGSRLTQKQRNSLSRSFLEAMERKSQEQNRA